MHLLVFIVFFCFVLTCKNQIRIACFFVIKKTHVIVWFLHFKTQKKTQGKQKTSFEAKQKVSSKFFFIIFWFCVCFVFFFVFW